MDFAKWLQYPVTDEDLQKAMFEVADWILDADPKDSAEFAAWWEVNEFDRVFCRAIAEHHREGRLTIVDEFGLQIWPGPGLEEWSYANGPNAPDRSRTAQPKKNINTRMLERIHHDSPKNKECFGWNSKQWARYLGCSVGAVVQTKSWKQLRAYRDASRRR